MEKETTPTPIEQIALEKYPVDLGHGVGNGIDYNYNNRLAFIAAFEYLGLADIPDPKKWVEERKANMYKETLAKIDLDKFNFEGKCKQLQAENEKLKQALGRIYTMDTTFENYINAIVELKQIAGDAIK
jgi:hypothetical protein